MVLRVCIRGVEIPDLIIDIRLERLVPVRYRKISINTKLIIKPKTSRKGETSSVWFEYYSFGGVRTVVISTGWSGWMEATKCLTGDRSVCKIPTN